MIYCTSKQQSKNLAAFGPTSFKSRSLQGMFPGSLFVSREASSDNLSCYCCGTGFQEDLEKGKSSHLFPAMFAQERVKNGQMKEEDVPYMQRGGSWDNSDVQGAKRKEWSETDKKMEIIPSWLRRGLAP